LRIPRKEIVHVKTLDKQQVGENRARRFVGVVNGAGAACVIDEAPGIKISTSLKATPTANMAK